MHRFQVPRRPPARRPSVLTVLRPPGFPSMPQDELGKWKLNFRSRSFTSSVSTRRHLRIESVEMGPSPGLPIADLFLNGGYNLSLQSLPYESSVEELGRRVKKMDNKEQEEKGMT